MYSNMENNVVTAKFDAGSDIMEDLREIAKKYDIASGSILWGIGMMRDFEIGYFKGQDYAREKFHERHEIVSFHGSISENEPRFHIHAAGANEKHQVIGGHFFSGIAEPLMEIQILKIGSFKITREMNKKLNVYEMKIQ